MLKPLIQYGLQKLIYNHLEAWKHNPKAGLDTRYKTNENLFVFDTKASIDFFAKQEIIDKADDILARKFNLLGSGDYQFDNEIPWHTDFVSDYKWQPKYYKTINKYPLFTTKKNIDLKLPWELSRCQHLPVLGMAYYITGDNNYAKEFVYQVKDWIEKNPYMIGFNWFVAMEVAIRAINWIWAYQLLKGSSVLTDDFKDFFFKSLYLHGRYIAKNLEEDSRGNHLIADLIGLIYLGLFFDTEESNAWQETGYKRIFQEIEYQIKEGVHYEQSTNYHFLVTEFVTSAILLAQANGYNIPERILNEYEKMLEFIMFYTRPDGTAPIIGDADDGRLYKIFVDDINDHRYLLNIGAVLFERADFKAAYPEFNPMSYLLLGERGLNIFDRILTNNQELKSRAYPETGFFISRHKDIYLLIKCGTIKKPEMTAHLHNDALSFVLSIGNRTILIDPGSYVYSRFPDGRNQFRGTAYHNTVMIDGVEQNIFSMPMKLHPRLFELKSYDTLTKLLNWETNQEYDLFEAEHYGYKKLNDPVVHKRKIYFDKTKEQIAITDCFECQREHKYEWFFHFAPMELEQDRQNHLIVRTKSEGQNIELIPQEDGQYMKCGINYGWISNSYGIRKKAVIVKYHVEKTSKKVYSFFIKGL